MLSEKRFGMGPVPKAPETFINERQVNGLPILKKFGWKLVCVRRSSINEAITILRNRREDLVGILGEDGILRINNTLKIRKTPIL
jgi:hypothetical protein